MTHDMRGKERELSHSPLQRRGAMTAAAVTLALFLLSPPVFAEDPGEDDEWDDWIQWDWALDCADFYMADWVWIGGGTPPGLDFDGDSILDDHYPLGVVQTGNDTVYLEGEDENGIWEIEEWDIEDPEEFWIPSTSNDTVGITCVETAFWFDSTEEYEVDGWCSDTFVLDLENPIGAIDLMLEVEEEGSLFFFQDGENIEIWSGQHIQNDLYRLVDFDDDEPVFELLDEPLNETDVEVMVDSATGQNIFIDEGMQWIDQVFEPPSFGNQLINASSWGMMPCWYEFGYEFEEEWHTVDYYGVLWVTLPQTGVPTGGDDLSPPDPENGTEEDGGSGDNGSDDSGFELPSGNGSGQSPPPDNSNSTFSDGLTLYGPAATAVTLTAVIGGMFAYSEAIRYPFSSRMWWAFGFLLGATRKDAGGAYQRGRIVGVITTNPGIHLSALIRTLGMGNHQAAHHLRVLEKEAIVWHRIVGREVRWFTADVPQNLATEELPKPKMMLSQDSIPYRILLHLMTLAGEGMEGCSQKKLAKEAGVSQQLASYHLRALTEYGLVEKRRAGIGNLVRITSEGLEALAGGEPPFEPLPEPGDDDAALYDSLLGSLSETL
jgi:DNA-binding MarR family transcriptional regulator